jgi:hypothetical protein
MSRGAVGCERSKLRATLTDEGGRQRSSGGIQRGQAPLGHRQWTGASRGRKWGRRCNALAWARGKWVKRVMASGDAFLWHLDGVGGEEKGGGGGVRLGATWG